MRRFNHHFDHHFDHHSDRHFDPQDRFGPCPPQWFPNQNQPSQFASPQVQLVDCGELRERDVGRFIELSGRVYKMHLGRFMHLKDSQGVTQVVVPESRWDLSKRLANLPLQSHIVIRGEVCNRPASACNEKMVTGRIEVEIDEILQVKVKRDDGAQARWKQIYSFTSSTEITSEEYVKCGSPSIVAKLKTRQYTCGYDLKEVLDKNVTLFGWVDSKTLPKFIQLRDGYGIVQCVLPEQDQDIMSTVSLLEPKSILEVKGTIANRPQPRVKNLQFYVNGGIELKVDSLQILKSLDTMETDDGTEVASEDDNVSGVCKFTNRTHTCGELRSEHVGKKVKLCGWLKSWRTPRFLSIEDAYGSTQCIIPDEFSGINLSETPIESVLAVEGIVNARPPNTVARVMPTGEIEVFVSDVQLLNAATNLPFQLQNQRPDDVTFYKHRYLAIRSRELQSNIRARSTISMNIRKFLMEMHGFVEVETPILVAKTPRDLSEFIVPTRQKGDFYCLSQNTHVFNQMLMSGGIDRCFQFARCFRSQVAGADEQPEYTQLQIELSFAGADDVIMLTEQLLTTCLQTTDMIKPFERLRYEEALEVYGSSEPDISYGLKLQNITDLIRDSISDVIDDFGAFILVVKNAVGNLTRTFNDSLVKTVTNEFSNITFVQRLITERVDLFKTKNVSSEINSDVIKSLINICVLEKGDGLYIAYGYHQHACLALGQCRTKIAEELKQKGQSVDNQRDSKKPVWIIDLPLFVKGKSGELKSLHHPFTAPAEIDIPLLLEDPLKSHSLSYKLVIDGQQFAIGSVRNHSALVQGQILEAMKTSSFIQANSSSALRSGCPPHAGIALDIDRLVKMGCDEKSVKNVIAFPKMENGKDLITGAPSTISDEDLNLYHIKVDHKEKSSNDNADGLPLPKKLKVDK